MLPALAKIDLKPIEECPGYSASADGRIWSHWHRAGFGPLVIDRDKPARELRQFDRGKITGGASPYLSVNATRNGKRCNRFVHELVLLAWVGPRPGSADEVEGCHCNGNSRDNRASNLRWDTVRANAWDREKHRDPAWEPPNGHDGESGDGHAFSDLIGGE